LALAGDAVRKDLIRPGAASSLPAVIGTSANNIQHVLAFPAFGESPSLR
jgi:hypothetical protein